MNPSRLSNEDADDSPNDDPSPSRGPRIRIGCVSYLNAKPLIHGIEDQTDVRVLFDVPSRMLGHLESGEVDMALCPVIDYFRSRVPLQIVPVGGIGCFGATLTVRLFSTTPIEDITRVHVDSHSHTSEILLRVVLNKVYGLNPQIVRCRVDDPQGRKDGKDEVIADQSDLPPALLIIGDKVVTSGPAGSRYPYQLDLGEAWDGLTAMPFVFAVWMARDGTDLRDIPEALRDRRVLNSDRVEQIVSDYATIHGWPAPLAKHYLEDLMRYEIGPPQLRAIERFATWAHELGCLDRYEPLRIQHLVT